MSVQNCAHCKSPYWRFRGDHPPKGVCSIPCYDARKAGKQSQAPPLPENVLRAMMAHRSAVHQTTSVLDWFECETCEKLEADYAEAIEWHVDRITREIVNEART